MHIAQPIGNTATTSAAHRQHNIDCHSTIGVLLCRANRPPPAADQHCSCGMRGIERCDRDTTCVSHRDRIVMISGPAYATFERASAVLSLLSASFHKISCCVTLVLPTPTPMAAICPYLQRLTASADGEDIFIRSTDRIGSNYYYTRPAFGRRDDAIDGSPAIRVNRTRADGTMTRGNSRRENPKRFRTVDRSFAGIDAWKRRAVCVCCVESRLGC